MRCPKCDYISFDKEEICGGCKKNISKFSQELSGVILRGTVPDFLWFEKPEEEPEEKEAAIEDENTLDGANEDGGGLDFGEDSEAEDETATDNTMEFSTDGDGIDVAAPAEEEAKEIEFDLSADAEISEEEEKEEIAFELPGKDKEAPSETDDGGLNLSMEAADTDGPSMDMSIGGLDEIDFMEEDESAAKPPPKPEKSAPKLKKEKAPTKEPSLDLSGLDLSGLMPPPAAEEQSSLSLGDIGELSLEGLSDSGKTGKKGKAKSAADMLSDLSMDGLDLNKPMSPPPTSTADKKLKPAAKTGTALDDFDIDLGDLLASSKEGKKKK
ncbi:hypothetical protein [Candidatus Electronema sp. PJ]|uniref:hypothetical protein n=1 Tax=Candidatus Electronema sp. PJ TaxID=3401572 RepID=UPI003AA84C94